jgi:hypothetical protein
MAKWCNDLAMDAMLDYIAAATRQVLCSAQPSTFAEANATFALADVTMSGADFSKANGDVSGRKLVVAAKNGVLIDASGTGNHVALLDVANSRLLYVTTCTPQAVVANGSNTTNIPSWDIEVEDPV